MKGKKDAVGIRAGQALWARDYRVAAAVLLGITCGVIWASLHPHGFFTSSKTASQTNFQGRGSQGQPSDGHVLRLEAKVSVLQSELVKLKTENKNLLLIKQQMQVAEQERDAARKQLLELGPPHKAGPWGTAKSLRTNQAVLPDESVNPDLAKLLQDVAINKELIVGISNNNVRSMLQVWFESIQRVGVTNYLVVALDDEIAQFCKDHKVPVYRRDATISKAQANTGDNHAISGLKFHLLREFLVLGYSVLLSDVDILYFQNPFSYLQRDCDVESMTDGYDNATAYGYDDVSDDQSMGWARYAHTMRIWVFNSGLFYIRPTVPSIELLDRVTDRLSKEKAWDQAVFNEELFYPSHPGYEGLHASRRVLDYLLFLNSKMVFKILRKQGNFAQYKPVTIHVNYHPDKYDRMVALIDYFVNGKTDALDRFPDGSEWPSNASR
ncbi:unnamed protein product [Sphagnum jensenii]|uniref:Glycosyltransferase n=1 Tax=Sphagnum jensenii TaxID=128206 RepID=A0ABP1ABH8_9BRYO